MTAHRVIVVTVVLGVGGLLSAASGPRFHRDSTSVIDMRDDDVLSKVDVIRDTSDNTCRAVYRWFTGTGGATVLGTVPCEAAPVDNEPLRTH